LASITSGFSNTAIGVNALLSDTTGFSNTATGVHALRSNTTGFGNTTTVDNALFFNTTGSGNTATGDGALVRNTTGNLNIALGASAGFNVTTGSNNIHIGNRGTGADNALIRIGEVGTQTATFIAGIWGVTTGANDALAVLIDSNGQLGTTNSSRWVKTDVHDLGDQSRALHQLRPVSFRYPSHPPDGPAEYGLISEEVAEIYPELVVRDKDGQPSGVRYHVLPAMLLSGGQRQQREIDELRAQVRALIGGRAAVRE
jgi:Chaperone of endosialidase